LIQGLEYQRPLLGRKAGAKAQRAVLVPVVVQVAVLVGGLGLVSADAAKGAQDPLELGGRGVARELE
jgi:hypothetical protein